MTTDLAGISVTEAASSGRLAHPQSSWHISHRDFLHRRYGLAHPLPMTGVSVSESGGTSESDLFVTVRVRGISTSVASGSGRLTVREHFSGVGFAISDGIGELTVAQLLAGASVTETSGDGRGAMPVDVAGVSDSFTDGTGSMHAPVPLPMDGPSDTLASCPPVVLGVLLVLRGPSFTWTSGSGEMTVPDSTGEVSETISLVRRLPDNYTKKRESVLVRLFRIVGAEFASLRQALLTTEKYHDIDQAVGASLDNIGNDVRQPRGQLNDMAYRAVIKAKIARQLSPGDIDSIKRIVAAMLDVQTADVGLRTLWQADPSEPAAVEVSAPMDALAQFNLTPTQFAGLLQRLVAGGVRVATMLEGTFELSEELEDDPEKGLQMMR